MHKYGVKPFEGALQRGQCCPSVKALFQLNGAIPCCVISIAALLLVELRLFLPWVFPLMTFKSVVTLLF